MRRMDRREKTASEQKCGGIWNVALDWVQALVASLVVVALCFTFGVRIVSVEGDSMEPALRHNDKLLVLSTIWKTPENGDVIVLRKDSFLDAPVVKRIIATEGQTIDIDFSTGTVYLDGEKLEEPYLKEGTMRPGDVEFPFTVSPGCVFVMGDHREASTDSRWSALGEVDRRYILGEAIWVLFSGGNDQAFPAGE